MPRRERSNLSLKLKTGQWLALWGVFWMSFIVRIFRISQPSDLYLEEPKLLSPAPSSCEPVGNRLFHSFNADTKLNFRFFNAVIGSLVPVSVYTFLQVHRVETTVSVIASMLMSLDYACVISSRTWNTKQIFVLLSVSALVAFSVGAKKRNATFTLLGSVLCALSCCYDPVGIVNAVFCLCYGKALLPLLLSAITLALLWLTGNACPRSWFPAVFPVNCYVFPLWMYAPKAVFQSNAITVSLANNPLTIALCSLFSGFSIFQLESAFYFITIIVVWLIHGVASPTNYELALVFGVVSVAKSLPRLPLWRFLAALIALLLLVSFVFWSALIYGFPLTHSL